DEKAPRRQPNGAGARRLAVTIRGRRSAGPAVERGRGPPADERRAAAGGAATPFGDQGLGHHVPIYSRDGFSLDAAPFAAADRHGARRRRYAGAEIRGGVRDSILATAQKRH